MDPAFIGYSYRRRLKNEGAVPFKSGTGRSKKADAASCAMLSIIFMSC